MTPAYPGHGAPCNGCGLTTPRAKATGIPRRDYSTSKLGSTHQVDPKFSDA